MKFYIKFVVKCAVYTIVIAMAFLIAGFIMRLPSLRISIGRLFLVLALGIAIASAELIFSIRRLSTSMKYALNYSALAFTFTMVFGAVRISDNTASFRFSTVLASLLIFSVAYLLAIVFRHCISRIRSKVRVCKKTPEKPKEDTAEKAYTPRFQ